MKASQALGIAQILAADSRGDPSVVAHGIHAARAAQALRAQHAVIVQMQAALETCDAGAVEDGGRQWYDDKLVDAALEAGEAYLRGSDASRPPEVERFALIGDPGAECVRNGHGYWELHRDGQLVRHLNRFERNYIDSALAAAS